MVPDPFSECGLDYRVSTRKLQTNPLTYLTRLLPLAVGNGDDQVRLRETDEFRRACVVTGCDTRSTDVNKNHLTCKPAGALVRGRSIGTCLLALFSNDDGENTVDLKIVYKIKYSMPSTTDQAPGRWTEYYGANEEKIDELKELNEMPPKNFETISDNLVWQPGELALEVATNPYNFILL